MSYDYGPERSRSVQAWLRDGVVASRLDREAEALEDLRVRRKAEAIEHGRERNTNMHEVSHA